MLLLSQQELEALRETLPPNLQKTGNSKIIQTIIDRSIILNRITYALALPQETELKTIYNIVRELAEYCGRSTAEINIQETQELVQLRDRLMQMEAENRQLRQESAKLQQVESLRQATAGIVRYKVK